MKSKSNILSAFLLNLVFSLIEIFGGIFTHSISIMSDAVHDFGDALSIGLSYFFEKKSMQKPDIKYTFGYKRYSVIGAFIMTLILTVGSILVIIESVKRIINPVEVNYNGMILIAIFGVIINFLAAYKTKDGHSLNEKAVNLHMLEDVLGWIVVLIGAILMHFTKVSMIDSIMSILVSSFILIHVMKNYIKIFDIFLEKTPSNVDVNNLKKELENIDEILDVHHIHIWSLDGNNNMLTMHVVTDAKDVVNLKKSIRNYLKKQNINHVTLEIESSNEDCKFKKCGINSK